MIRKRPVAENPSPISFPAGRAAVYRQFCLVGARDQKLRILSGDVINQMVKDYPFAPLARNESTDLVLLEVTDEKTSVETAIVDLQNDVKYKDLIESAEPNRILGKSTAPNDPLFPEQWAWARLGAQAAWDRIDPNAAPVVVAIVDTGIADNHEDLQPYLLPPYTVIGETRDDEGHGTLLAGTIGAVRANKLGIAGAAAVQLLPVKFCSQQVCPTAALGAIAIADAVDKGADVINLSWDCGFRSKALRRAINHAGDMDAIVVVAAGNWGLDNDKYPNWPANFGEKRDYVITVMATDKDDDRASFSSFGRKTVYIAAPGVDVLSTAAYAHDPGIHNSIRPGYRSYQGTSAAAAHVSGLVALIRMQNPTWTPKQVKDHLRHSAEPVRALKRRCVSEGIASYGRAICGPITVLSPVSGDSLTENTYATVTWKHAYSSPMCATLKLTFIDSQGNQTQLAHGVASAAGSVSVKMPSQLVKRARLRLSSEQHASFYADSGVFMLVP